MITSSSGRDPLPCAGDTIDDELDYIVFRDEVSLQRRSNAFLVAYFGAAKAAQFRLRYDAEKAAGLISISTPDCGKPCTTCGCYGCNCERMTMDKWNRTLGSKHD